MRVALVHEWLVTLAGSEKVVEATLELFADAPVYTLVCDPDQCRGTRFAQHTIHTSFINRLPFARTRYRAYLPLMPLAVEQFDLDRYDVIISSSHAVAKGVITRADQLHISFVHSPPRYAWDLRHSYLKDSKSSRGLKGLLTQAMLHYFRLWDFVSAQRVDCFVASSHFIARRIWKTYRREATVIYPPVSVERFRPSRQRENYYCAVSRFVPYKKMDLIVAAFSRMQLPLVVIGDGPEWHKVKRMAAPNVSMLGWQPHEVMREHLERCKAFVFAGEEDFGIVLVEAQAAGAPVIAYGVGGARETVLEGETGLFFQDQSVEALIAAVHEFETGNYQFDAIRIGQHAERFNKRRFQTEFGELVHQQWAKFAGSERSSRPQTQAPNGNQT
jgi:glycosyltransferase involved in cell wall biosynthesis